MSPGPRNLRHLSVSYPHPFMKPARLLLIFLGLFLALNGYRLTATQADATLTVLALAAGEIDEPAFVNWIRERSVKR